MAQRDLRYVIQNWKKIKFYIVILIFLVVLDVFSVYILMHSSSPLTSSNRTVYVGVNESGNFTCDGSDDQVEINKALAYVVENPQFTTVHLKGPNTSSFPILF